MAGTLENVLQTNKHLQTTINRLQDEVEQKAYLAEQLKGARLVELRFSLRYTTACH
jgi:hypothetical protein